MDRESAGRRLSLFASTLFLIYHFSAAYLCTYLPDDPLYLSVGITGYVWYGCALSVLGLVGAAKRQPILLAIFSNHLLIDTVLSCIPKLGLLYFFSDLTRTVCVSATQWHHSPSPLMDKRGGMMPEDPHRALTRKRQCEVSFLVAQIALLAILVVWTAAQWSLGMAIRGYADRLEAAREGRERSADADLEKAELDVGPRETGYAAEEKKGLLRVGELEVERVEKVQ